MNKNKGYWGNQYMKEGKTLSLHDYFMSIFQKCERQPNGCLTGFRLDIRGYPHFGRRENKIYKKYPAHRLAYQYFKGEIPAGLVIRHLCNNPACVEPEHLASGTVKDNVQDLYKTGFKPSPKKKLTEWHIKEIQTCLANGESINSIAKRFDVARVTITRRLQRAILSR